MKRMKIKMRLVFTGLIILCLGILLITPTQAVVDSENEVSKELEERLSEYPLIRQSEGESGIFETDLKKPKLPKYAPGEVLVGLKEGSDIEDVLKETALEAKGFGRVHDIKPAVNKFKKTLKLEKDSKGWLRFLGKNYKEVEDIPDGELFKETYKSMPEVEKRLYRSYKIKLPEGITVEEAVAKLKENPDVEYAEPNYLAEVFYIPNDPLYPQQWTHQETQAEAGWDIQRGSPNVVIAIVDTGVDYNHEDLAANIWRDAEANSGKDFVDIDTAAYIAVGYQLVPGEDYTGIDNDPSDYFGHGTHVAGIAGAVGGNGVGVAGVCHSCKIMPVRAGFSIIDPVYGEVGILEDDDIANAITFAVDNGAKVINMSFGGTESTEIKVAIDDAYSKGVTLLAAAGNSKTSIPSYPAAYENVIAVAATAEDDSRARYSNYGPWVDVSAPGGDITKDSMILSTVPKTGTLSDPSGYRALQGTSMACPYVSGLASLLISKNPTWNNALVKGQLTHTTENIDLLNPGYKGLLGSGRINTYKALITTPEPDIMLEGYSSDDTAGNGNGLIEPGETINLSVHLRNTWQDARNVRVTLTTDDPHITITDGTFSFPELLSGVCIANLLEPYVFTVDPSSPSSRNAVFTLVIDADGGYSRSETFGIPISMPMQSGWPRVLSSQRVGSPTLADIDEDGISEVIITSENKVYAWNGDGTGVVEADGGFAIPDENDIFKTSPALGDIDGDGDIEIVVGASNGKIYAWHSNGNRVNGWPLTMVNIIEPIRDFIFGEITLADIDGDRACEILFEGTTLYQENNVKGFPVLYRKIEVYALEGNGTLIWSNIAQDGPGFGGYHPSLSIGDINAGGDKEIVANTDNKTILYYHDGKIIDNWPVVNQDPYHPEIYAVSNSSPVLGDFDGGSLEIMTPSTYLRTDGLIVRFSKICVWHLDATELNGWPVQKSTIDCFRDGYPPINDVVLGDIDGDGSIEVIAGGNDGLVYAWEHDGTQIVNSYSVDPIYYPAWPAYPEWEYICPEFGYPATVLSSPVLGDIDGDGDIEILVISRTNTDVAANGKLCVLHHNGALVESFPMKIDSSFISSPASPALGDIDGDGDIEIIAASDNEVYVWGSSGEYNPTKMEWPMFRHDSKHTGCYVLPNITPPTVLMTASPTTVLAGEPITLTVSGTSAIGLAAVWWFVEDQDDSSWHEIPGTVDGNSKNLAAAQDFAACSGGATSCSYTRAVTIAEAGRYLLKANSRDVLYPVPGEAHQASEGDGLAVVEVIVIDKTPPTPPGTPYLSAGTNPNNTGTYSISWTASTDTESGLKGYEVWRNGAKVTPTPITANSYTENNLPQGSYTYAIYAVDNVNNTSSPSGTSVFIVVDKTKPAITNIFDAPDPFFTKKGQVSKISYTLGDNLSLNLTVSVEISTLSGSLVRTLGPYSKSLGANSTIWNGKNSSGVYVANDTYRYRIRAQDLAGNYIYSGYYYVTKR